MKIACLLFVSVALMAQSNPPKRPRIGLALEGGGALGLAHIGVIRYLEQHHIPVDIVVGTSMGGLVGGLYATGRSAAEIQELTNEIDWGAVLSGNTVLQDLSFRRKEDRIAFPNRLEFGLKHKKLSFPAGLNSGHQAGLVFDRATLAYGNLSNFDDLPIPFRCVATDVTVGREEIFSSGSLSQALRATMSIPAVFSPVTIGGHVYTDGGAVNNLPVDVARGAGADIVIAVFLDQGAPDAAAYESPLGVASRNISIMVSVNELRSMASADVLIDVNLQGVASFDFKKAEQIIPKGYEAAVKKKGTLDKFALNPQDWQAYLSAREKKTLRSLPVPQFVSVAGAAPDYARTLQESLTQYIGKPINPSRVEESLTRMTGTGAISSVGYALADRNGTPGLETRTYPKTYGPPFLNFGIAIDGSNPENVLFGVAARLTFLDLGGYRAEWRNDAFFGSTYGLSSEYYRPFTATSNWFFAPRLYSIHSPFNVYLGQQRTDEYRVGRDGLGLDLGYALSRRAEVRVGQDLLWFRTRKVVTSDPFPDTSQRQIVSSVHFRYYGVDNVQVPRSGLNVAVDGSRVERSGQMGSFSQAQLLSSYFQPLSPAGSIFVRAEGGTSFGASSNRLDLQAFSLGGPLRLGAYGQNELLGNQYFLLQSGYEHKLLPLSPLLGEGVYGIALIEFGKIYNTLDITSPPSSAVDGSVALIARTFIGPIFIGGSFGNENHRKWWFGLGRVF